MLICIVFSFVVYQARKKMNNKIVAVVAGHSGGHIVPGISLAKKFIEKNPTYKILFFSSDALLDQNIIKSYPEINYYYPLTAPTFPGFNILRYPKFFWENFKSFFKTFKVLYDLKPEKLLTTGGHVSFGVSLCSWLMNIPVELYVLDAVPGKAAKSIAPLATNIFAIFEDAKKYFNPKKVKLGSYPIQFKDQDKITKSQAYQKLNLDENKKTLLVLGGSQGSSFINNLVANFATQNPEFASKIQIVHQAGSGSETCNVKTLKELYEKLNIKSLVFDYTKNINLSYNAADLIIARAGAGTIFETIFFEKPAILIPLKTKTTEHQVDNALAIQNQYPKLFTVFDQDETEKDHANLFNLIKSKLT